jgi:D-3-phosphoglycerate dehydrogenase
MPIHNSSKPLVIFPDADAEGIALLAEALQTIDASSITIQSHLGVPDSDDAWIERVAPAEGLLLGWQLPDAALKSADKLRAISFLGTGASDHIDLAIATAQGVHVMNVSGYGDDAVAEHAIALMFAAARNVVSLDRRLRIGEWPSSQGLQLRGRRLAVVGLGGIGRRMVEIGRGLGMDVVAWNRSAETGNTESHGVALLPLDELLATSDVVSLHVALNEDTTGMIDGRRLRLMKLNAILINTSRGAVIDEAELVRVLDDGHLRTAALDVFSAEPAPADHRLLNHERTIVTPHVAFNTHDASLRLFQMAVQNLVDHFASSDIK